MAAAMESLDELAAYFEDSRLFGQAKASRKAISLLKFVKVYR